MKRRKVYGVLSLPDGSTIPILNAQVAEYISSLIEQRDMLRAAVEAYEKQRDRPVSLEALVAEEREACILIAKEIGCPAEDDGQSSCGDIIADLIRERRK